MFLRLEPRCTGKADEGRGEAGEAGEAGGVQEVGGEVERREVGAL